MGEVIYDQWSYMTLFYGEQRWRPKRKITYRFFYLRGVTEKIGFPLGM